jgi:uncharacterized DUF497 family protein
MKTQFQWDDDKAKTNLAKLHVSFETAARAFLDPFQLTEQSRIENGEYRWQTMGMVDAQMVLFVAHTVSDDEQGAEIIRIISARKADPTGYWGHTGYSGYWGQAPLSE